MTGPRQEDRVPDLAAAVAAHGLPGAPPLPAEPLCERDWVRLVARVNAERIPGLLSAAVHDGALAATSRQAAEAERAHLGSMQTAVLLEEHLLATLGRLDGAGIDSRVLKGSSVAHLDYPDPALRSFGDVDLLVRASRLADATKLFSGEWARDLPERRPGFDSRFGREIALLGRGRFDIDLHRTLVPGPFGLAIAIDELWEPNDLFELGDRQVRVLSAPMRFVLACYTSMLSDSAPRLVALRDMAEVARARRLDLSTVESTAKRWRGEVVIASAVSTCLARLGPVLPGSVTEWARALQPDDGLQRRMLRCYGSAGGTNSLTLLAGWLGVAGVRQRGAYLRAVLLPSREYRRARREHGRPSEWRRGALELLRGRGWGTP